MIVPSEVTRGLYRTIVRHLTYIDPKLIKPVRQQFQRRRKYAKLGHIRAGYTLEEQLRQVIKGTMTLDEVKANFTTPKSNIEINAQSKRYFWLKSDERRWDAYNAGPDRSSLEYARVHMAAGLNNARFRYIHLTGLDAKECDFSTIDTVLAVRRRRSQAAKRQKQHLERIKQPRKAIIRWTRRSSTFIYFVQAQGREGGLRAAPKVLALAKKREKALDKYKQSQGAEKKATAAKVEKLTSYFQMQRQLVRQRARVLQKKLKYEHRLQQQNKVVRKEELRLREL